MRAYTLSVLSQLANTGNVNVEKEVVKWVNTKLQSAGKATSIRSFQDSSISNAKVVLDLIDAIKPGSINYELVAEGDEYEVRIYFAAKIDGLTLTRIDFCRKSLRMQSMPFRWQEKSALAYMPCPKTLRK